jgi:hypothetical protein
MLFIVTGTEGAYESYQWGIQISIITEENGGND